MISRKCYIHPSCDVRGVPRLEIEDGVVIQQDCWIDIAYDNPHHGPMIFIGEGTNIGRRTTISSANIIAIGKHVLIGINVYITDTGHEYHNPDIPIMYQGITDTDVTVQIGDDSWIGANAVILGASIGKHCVVGANTVLVKTIIPDYSVVVGNPARIIKTIQH